MAMLHQFNSKLSVMQMVESHRRCFNDSRSALKIKQEGSPMGYRSPNDQ